MHYKGKSAIRSYVRARHFKACYELHLITYSHLGVATMQDSSSPCTSDFAVGQRLAMIQDFPPLCKGKIATANCCPDESVSQRRSLIPCTRKPPPGSPAFPIRSRVLRGTGLSRRYPGIDPLIEVWFHSIPISARLRSPSPVFFPWGFSFSWWVPPPHSYPHFPILRA